MPAFVFIGLIIAGLMSLLVVLGFGLRALKQGDSARSQTLMRWRIGVQFAVVLLIVTLFVVIR